MDIKWGGSQNSILNFYDQMVRAEKGWVEHEFVLFIICHIATWNKVAKWVTIIQDSRFVSKYQDWVVSCLTFNNETCVVFEFCQFPMHHLIMGRKIRRLNGQFVLAEG